jgi:GNAT superfamily N-acetyltransferase
MSGREILAVCREMLQTRCVLRVAALRPSELETVDQHLPLNRLDQYVEDGSTYLIAWDDDLPVGHAHIAWQRTHAGVPEIQDVFVVPERRRQGLATTLTRAAEDEVRRRGWDRISLSVSAQGNEPARRLYDRLGYRTAGCAPVRVHGTITLRGRAVEVDDTLEFLERHL